MIDASQLFSAQLGHNLEGLELSNILFKEPSELTPNPLNAAFDELKDANYLAGLQQDIAANGIVNPLIATASGLLIEGHSRLKVALTLGLSQVPVRLILSPLSEELLKERLYLGNLHRFEISKDMRTKLFADLYPHIFYDAATTIPDSLAKAMGISISQVRNEKQLLLLAMQIKEENNDNSPLSLADMQQARKLTNQARRERERIKRLQWQTAESLPHAESANQESLPLFLCHDAPIVEPELDIHQEYKLISKDSRCYAIYTKTDRLIAQLDPQTFSNLEQLDSFAKQLILLYHQLRKESKSLEKPNAD